MLIKDIRDINEENLKQTSKEVFLNMDEFFKEFYKGSDEVALLLITPKQAVAAHANREINHNVLYTKMVPLLYETGEVNPIIQIKCSSRCDFNGTSSVVPNLMVPYSPYSKLVDPNSDTKILATKKEFDLLKKLKDIGFDNKIDFMGCMYEFMNDLELCDDSKGKFVDENIIGCSFKKIKSKDDKEIDCR